MAAYNKIERMNLGTRILELSGAGETTHRIAEIVSKELEPLNESLSQRTVARYLKSVREDRAEETRSIVQEHIKKTVPADLHALEEVEAWLLDVFRNHEQNVFSIKHAFLAAIEGKESWRPSELVALYDRIIIDRAAESEYDVRQRQSAAMNLIRVVETKLRFSGILETPEDKTDDIRRQAMQELADEAGFDIDIDSLGEAIGRAA